MGDGQVFFASVPPYKPRSKLPPAVVDRCLTLWSAGLHSLRQLPDTDFAKEVSTNKSLAKFIQSYILNDELSRTDPDDWLYPFSTSSNTQKEASKAKYIKHSVWACLKRAAKLLCADALIAGSQTIIKLAALFFPEGGARSLLRSLWADYESTIREAVKEQLKLISTTLGELSNGTTKPEEQHVALLQEFCYLVMALPEISDEVLSDETVFESLAGAYNSSQKKGSSPTLLEEMRRLPFTVIMAATQTDQKKYSQLIDFLFNFTSSADSESQKTYITAIVSETPLLERLAAIDAAAYKNRWKTILQKLAKFDKKPLSGTSKRIPRLPRRKARLKKPEDAITSLNTSAQRVAELKELFPHTDSSVLLAILESVNNDVEAATMALLDGSAPADDDYPPLIASNTQPPPAFAPRDIPDVVDELDELAVPTARLYMGKRGLESTADGMLADRGSAPSKEKILAALQSFDSDDDERDDTYDQEDIGGAVDNTVVDSEVNAVAVNAASEGDEKVLYKALVGDASVFLRDVKTRRSEARKQLKEATGMTDEAIEGWKIMLDRDGGKRLRQLEIKFSRENALGGGEQAAISRTAYRKGDEEDEEEGGQGGSRGPQRRFGGPNDRIIRGDQKAHAPVAGDGKAPWVGKKTTKARGEHSRKMQSAARDRQRTKKMAKGM
ncbi:hypothetical protein H072_5956 [Dactylellina haptotyla CBS 200.50]|uniref:CUE domain-containing protein n=1 Tax=Dactylellina haptotyla (strain CBS 200.50) TaxID=1284197 RepID=S8AGF1_DACHA|nr:hypothetical protein H072_5956 [Dactylellina haptotyla CBS 200.50]